MSVYVRMRGTLGDMMFQYTMGRSIADGHGLAFECLRAPSLWNTYFPNAPLKCGGERLPGPPIRLRPSTDSHRLDVNSVLTANRALHIDAAFHRREHYSWLMNKAREWFAITPKADRVAVEPEDLVVHISANLRMASRGWVLPPSYYSTAVSSVPDCGRILVCGDHRSLDALPTSLAKPSVLLIGGGVRTQLSIMLQARQSVISNDTTAWWAASLSGAVRIVAPETSTGGGFAYWGYGDVDLRLPSPAYVGIDVPRFAAPHINIVSKAFGANVLSAAGRLSIVLPSSQVIHCPPDAVLGQLITALLAKRKLTAAELPGGARSAAFRWAIAKGLAEVSLRKLE